MLIRQKPLGVGFYFFTLVLFLVPIVNLVFFIPMMFNNNTSKRNFAISALLLNVVVLIVCYYYRIEILDVLNAYIV